MVENKDDLQVENNPLYIGRSKKVSSLFLPNEKSWDVTKVRHMFMPTDADAILQTYIPQRNMVDRVAWDKSSNGVYTPKSAYHYWFDCKFGSNMVPQSLGWKKIWHLKIPHKTRVFIWRFCRNAIPVRRRLSSKGVRVGITCPMCVQDVEHLAHLFYYCSFAKGCWSHVDMQYDWSGVEYAPDWVVDKLTTASTEEVKKICMVL